MLVVLPIVGLSQTYFMCGACYERYYRTIIKYTVKQWFSNFNGDLLPKEVSVGRGKDRDAILRRGGRGAMLKGEQCSFANIQKLGGDAQGSPHLLEPAVGLH